MKVLEEFPEDSVDLVFADPPYRLSNGGFTCKGGKRVSVNKGKWDEAQSLDEDHNFNVRWLRECQRILKPSGTLWVSGTQHVIYSLGFALQNLGFHLLNSVTWLKPNASPNLSCRYFTHSTEILIWASPAWFKPLRHTFNYKTMKEENGGKQMRDLWEITTTPQSEKLYGRHPTQKPLKLLRRIVKASTNPGDVVVDPFAGSCTTGVACAGLGRRFIGIDQEEEYLDIGRKRLGYQAVPPTINIENFLSHPVVREWLQTLYDCPPGIVRSGYDLLTAYWKTHTCSHAVCFAADGCIPLYDDACRTVDRALQSLVDMSLISVVGRGSPTPGHTHDAGCSSITKIRSGETWEQRTAPAYIWGFESGDALPEYLYPSEK